MGWALVLKQDAVERGLCCGHPDARKEERPGLGDWVSECPSAQWRPGPDSACQRTRALSHPSPKICCLLLAIHGAGSCPHHPAPTSCPFHTHSLLPFSGPVTFQKGSGVGAGWQLSRGSESKLMSSLGLLLSPGLEGEG